MLDEKQKNFFACNLPILIITLASVFIGHINSKIWNYFFWAILLLTLLYFFVINFAFYFKEFLVELLSVKTQRQESYITSLRRQHEKIITLKQAKRLIISLLVVFFFDFLLFPAPPVGIKVDLIFYVLLFSFCLYFIVKLIIFKFFVNRYKNR